MAELLQNIERRIAGSRVKFPRKSVTVRARYWMPFHLKDLRQPENSEHKRFWREFLLSKASSFYVTRGFL